MPGMNPKNKRHVVCAALAAADCAYAAGQHREDPVRHPDWLRDWRDVQGGGCRRDDAVTQWMVRKLVAIARMPQARGRPHATHLIASVIDCHNAQLRNGSHSSLLLAVAFLWREHWALCWTRFLAGNAP